MKIGQWFGPLKRIKKTLFLSEAQLRPPVTPKYGITSSQKSFSKSIHFHFVQKSPVCAFQSPAKSGRRIQKWPIFQLWGPPVPQQGHPRPRKKVWWNWGWVSPSWAIWPFKTSRVTVRIVCLLLGLCVKMWKTWLSLFIDGAWYHFSFHALNEKHYIRMERNKTP